MIISYRHCLKKNNFVKLRMEHYSSLVYISFLRFIYVYFVMLITKISITVLDGDDVIDFMPITNVAPVRLVLN